MTTHTDNTSDAPTVAELLAEYRRINGLPKAEMTRRLNLTPLTYRHWENGSSQPEWDKANKIAKAIEVSRYVVLAGMGILTEADVEVLENQFGGAIPGYAHSHGDNPLLRLVAAGG